MPYVSGPDGQLVWVPAGGGAGVPATEPNAPAPVSYPGASAFAPGVGRTAEDRLALQGTLRPPTVAGVTPQPAPGTTGMTTEQRNAAINADTQMLRDYNEATRAQFAQSDAGVQRAVQAPAAPVAPTAERGDYNMTNTPAGSLPQPQSAGINFGFGVGGAPTAQQYLQQMDQRDAVAAARRDQRQQQRAQDYQLAELRSLRGDPVAYRQALRELELVAPGAAGAREATAALTAEQARAQAQQGIAGLQAAAGLQQASLENQGRLQAAALTGQYGVDAALARAQGHVTQAQLESMSPEAQRAAAEAALLGLQYDAIIQGLQTRQIRTPQEVVSASRKGQEPREVQPTNLQGVPYTEEAIRLLQERELRNLRGTEQ